MLAYLLHSWAYGWSLAWTAGSPGWRGGGARGGPRRKLAAAGQAREGLPGGAPRVSTTRARLRDGDAVRSACRRLEVAHLEVISARPKVGHNLGVTVTLRVRV